jgi:hypothetical protein
MNREKFIEFINIDEEGHYPFYMFVEKADSSHHLVAMALNDVHLVYAQAAKYLMDNPRKVYFTLDFPAMKDIKTDFVGVYFKEMDAPWESVIIPYDKNGSRLELITSGEMFDILLAQCRKFARPLFKVVPK